MTPSNALLILVLFLLACPYVRADDTVTNFLTSYKTGLKSEIEQDGANYKDSIRKITSEAISPSVRRNAQESRWKLAASIKEKQDLLLFTESLHSQSADSVVASGSDLAVRVAAKKAEVKVLAAKLKALKECKGACPGSPTDWQYELTQTKAELSLLLKESELVDDLTALEINKEMEKDTPAEATAPSTSYNPQLPLAQLHPPVRPIDPGVAWEEDAGKGFYSNSAGGGVSPQ
jgi:hypothetical protein